MSKPASLPEPTSARVTLIQQIELLSTQMRAVVLAAGVKPEDYDKPFNMLPNVTDEQLATFYKWFSDFHTGAYIPVVQVWTQRPPEYWQGLENLGETHFPEQILLRERRKALRKAWRRKNGRPKQAAESDDAEEVSE